MALTREAYLMGREVEYPLNEDMEVNTARLLYRIRKLVKEWGGVTTFTSGYRPGRYNTAAGGAKGSAHLTCEAGDVLDADGKLKQWIAANPWVLIQCDLWMEDPSATPTWCHLQSRPVKSGQRIFGK